MAKYDVTATVTISTSIEPTGYLDEPTHVDGIEEFDAGSFQGYGNDIDDSCQVTLVYESDADEDEIEDEIQSKLTDHLNYDGDDNEWEVTDVTIDSVAKQQMTTETAVQTLRSFLDSREDAFREHHPAVFEAIETLLQQF